MNIQCTEDQSSDEEIFFGQFTMKEVKKRLIPVYHRQTVGYCATDSKDEANTSLKLIETHSAPDVSSKGDLLSPDVRSESGIDLSPDPVNDWDIKPDDSFLRLEQMVSNMCVSPEKPDPITSDTSKYFFKNLSESHVEEMFPRNDMNSEIKSQLDDKISKITLPSASVDIQVTTSNEDEPNLPFKTPLKNNFIKSTPSTPQVDVFKTPPSDLKTKTPVFKTPANSLSLKKHIVTPSRKYQNVASPVATYIRNCPQVPLMKDVCPKRPLPGLSSIPKPVKHISHQSLGNKENVPQENVNTVKKEKQGSLKLPAVAYRSAKETKVIDIPDVGKMPQNQWAKQVASSIPRAMVVRHNHRKTSFVKKPLQHRQEDSFADLSLHQADLSVCTQKSTFGKPKKNV